VVHALVQARRLPSNRRDADENSHSWCNEAHADFAVLIGFCRPGVCESISDRDHPGSDFGWHPGLIRRLKVHGRCNSPRQYLADCAAPRERSALTSLCENSVPGEGWGPSTRSPKGAAWENPALGAGRTENNRSRDRFTQGFPAVLSLNKVNEPMLHIRPRQLCAHLVANM
jgi:hypothetical protein